MFAVSKANKFLSGFGASCLHYITIWGQPLYRYRIQSIPFSMYNSYMNHRDNLFYHESSFSLWSIQTLDISILIQDSLKLLYYLISKSSHIMVFIVIEKQALFHRMCFSLEKHMFFSITTVHYICMQILAYFVGSRRSLCLLHNHKSIEFIQTVSLLIFLDKCRLRTPQGSIK